MLGLAACTSSRMAAAPEPVVIAAPQPDKSTVVFYRSSALGGAVQSSVFDVTTGPATFVGIISTGMKLAYVAAPGDRRFMVIGESADFMDAELVPGRTYYALVAPRIGVWKARFSLRPRAADDKEMQEQLATCHWYDNTPASQQWAEEHLGEIVALQKKYLPEWLAKANEKPMLHAAGRTVASPSSSRAWIVVRTITRGSSSGQGRPRCIVARLSHITTSPWRQRWR
jgi:hypothetical protein